MRDSGDPAALVGYVKCEGAGALAELGRAFLTPLPVFISDHDFCAARVKHACLRGSKASGSPRYKNGLTIKVFEHDPSIHAYRRRDQGRAGINALIVPRTARDASGKRFIPRWGGPP